MSIKSIYGFQAPLCNINKAKEFLCVTINSLKFETLLETWTASAQSPQYIYTEETKIQFTFPLEIKI